MPVSTADVKRQNFNPDNVFMHEMKEGELLNRFQMPIMADVMKNSVVFKLGKYQEMNGKSEIGFNYWADKPGAYWVGEGRKIQTTKATMLQATMRAHKVATIVVVSREYLHYTYSQFFNAIKPQLSEALWKKVDEATILGADNPYTKSIESVVTETGKVVTGDFTYDNVLALEDALLEAGVTPNAFISKTQNRTGLRKVVNKDANETLYDRKANTLDGMPIVELHSDEMKKGDLYTGDFNKLFYGIPYNINYSISEVGQLSTIVNEDGTPVNLFEQELIALRVTMDVATLVAQDDAFAKLTSGEVASEPAEEEVASV